MKVVHDLTQRCTPSVKEKKWSKSDRNKVCMYVLCMHVTDCHTCGRVSYGTFRLGGHMWVVCKTVGGVKLEV